LIDIEATEKDTDPSGARADIDVGMDFMELDE